jgi:hypothetical protein
LGARAGLRQKEKGIAAGPASKGASHFDLFVRFFDAHDTYGRPAEKEIRKRP